MKKITVSQLLDSEESYDLQLAPLNPEAEYSRIITHYHGTFHCGKGEPGQAMHLSHGVAPARFRNIVCNVKA